MQVGNTFVCCGSRTFHIAFVLLFAASISTMEALKAPVGFIGLGIMGKGMVKNLISKLDPSLPFVLWNRSPEACEQIVGQYPDRVSIPTVYMLLLSSVT